MEATRPHARQNKHRVVPYRHLDACKYQNIWGQMRYPKLSEDSNEALNLMSLHDVILYKFKSYHMPAPCKVQVKVHTELLSISLQLKSGLSRKITEEIMSETFPIKLSFDPLLKPRLFGIQESLACAQCRSWFNPKICFMVNLQGLSTVQDLEQLVRSEHGILTGISFEAGGYHVPVDLPIEYLKEIKEQIDVIPCGPTAPRVNFPTCSCAAVAGAAQVGQMTPGLSGTGNGNISRTSGDGSSDETMHNFNQDTSVWSDSSQLDQSQGPYTGNMVAWGNFPRM